MGGRTIFGIAFAVLGLLLCIHPALALKEILELWWYWHDVPKASILNIDTLDYSFFGLWHFSNSQRMYAMVICELLIGLTLLGVGVVLGNFRQRSQ